MGEVLVDILRTSMLTEEVSKDWRDVVPVYRKGNRSKPWKDRPVSLICTVY